MGADYIFRLKNNQSGIFELAQNKLSAVNDPKIRCGWKDFDVLVSEKGTTPASGVVPCALARHIVEWSHDNTSGESTEGDTRGRCGTLKRRKTKLGRSHPNHLLTSCHSSQQPFPRGCVLNEK